APSRLPGRRARALDRLDAREALVGRRGEELRQGCRVHSAVARRARLDLSARLGGERQPPPPQHVEARPDGPRASRPYLAPATLACALRLRANFLALGAAGAAAFALARRRAARSVSIKRGNAWPSSRERSPA